MWPWVPYRSKRHRTQCRQERRQFREQLQCESSQLTESIDTEQIHRQGIRKTEVIRNHNSDWSYLRRQWINLNDVHRPKSAWNAVLCYPSLSTLAASEILYNLTKIQYTCTTILQRTAYILTIWLGCYFRFVQYCFGWFHDNDPLGIETCRNISCDII
jgi:hypothetical protein